MHCGWLWISSRQGYSMFPSTTQKFLTSKNELFRKRRALWLAEIKRKDSKLKYQRVCSSLLRSVR